MNGVITMTKKNLETLKVMALLREKKLTQIEARKRLRLTDIKSLEIKELYQENWERQEIDNYPKDSRTKH